MRRVFFIVIILMMASSKVSAQFYGTVVDGQTNEPLPFVTARYVGTSIGAVTDMDGKFEVPITSEHSKLEVSAVGYKTLIVSVNYQRAKQNSTIKLFTDNVMLGNVTVVKKREKYKRKENPAVELMRKVIANKKLFAIENNDYYQLDKYERRTFSVNEVSAKTWEKQIFRPFKFLADHEVVCPETGKLILPLWFEESFSQTYYRKDPKAKKTYVREQNSEGYNTLFTTGDFFNDVIKDAFTDVNIYQDNIRLLKNPFISPISSTQAIAFYHYYINDTIEINGQRCIDVAFTPANPQDFGFMGNLYILDDGSYQVARSLLNIPSRSGVNFVDNLLVQQDFALLPNGQRVMTVDDMIVELTYIFGEAKFQVQRYTTYNNFQFEEFSDKSIYQHKQVETVDADAASKDSTFWQSVRTMPLSEAESTLDEMVNDTKKLSGYQVFMLVVKAFLENSVELTKAPNKFDLMPINTIVSNSYVDGFRLRLGGQTTGNLNPHLFFRGFGAYGFKDEKFKYKAEVEYSFNKKKYMAHEFPRRSFTATYSYDTMSPVDKFSGTDKDNMLTAFKTTKVDKMMYVRNAALKWTYETNSFFTTTIDFSNSNIEPAGKLVYQRMGTNELVKDITLTELKTSFRYAPNEKFGNSKQRRQPTNHNAAIMTLEHTMGINKLFGSQYNYHLTEASFYKRLYLPYACGYLESYFKGGVQWSQVPFPLLFVPASNLSYFVQFDSWSFNMLDNMEFLNDRYFTAYFNWSLNGKLLNRVPLLNKLKLREYLGFKMMMGGLSDKNNPFISTDDSRLFAFPTRGDDNLPTRVMGSKPYMEFSVGISNIFNILTIEYVRRLNYHYPDVKKNGIRFEVKIAY